MSDYIKREDAIKWLKNLFDDCGNYMPLWHYGEVLPKIIELLEVDVAPVRHGRWIECTSSPHWKCSMCGTKAPIWFDEFNEICEWLSVYCPNCGAKMDGEDDE